MKKNLSPAVPTNALSTDEGSENAVDPDYYEELAEFVVSYINAIKRETGVEMYAVSLQNEPNFDKRYESCKYTPNELKQLTSIVKARFQRENLTTKIFGPETIPDNPETNDYRNATLKDLDYFGLHLYSNDGFNEATISPSKWSQIHSLMHSQREDIGIWITETSGEPATEEGAIHLANKMATALTYGNVQAYCYWTFFARSSDEKFGLYSPANKFLKKYYAFKNYSAFIKPGAVRVEASSPSRDLLVTAFVNTDSTIALVVVNNGEQDFRLDLDMQLIENKTGFSAYRTARGLDCLRLENPTEQLTIARRSITTYVSKLSGPEKPPVVAGTDFKVFPVPANEVINVTIPLNRYDNVRIIDVLGRIVRESVVPEGKEDLTFLIDNLDMGIYIVEATGENLRSRKMILVR
jgi:glucuronoarabinoxylan endo-1,4-beta-xylanase